MQKIIYRIGDVLGNNITFIQEVVPKRKNYRRAEFKCHCETYFICDITAIKSLNTKSCGCLNTPELISQRETKHGLYNHPLYKRWISIKDRCYRKNSERYSNYGGRGIMICDSWKNDFLSFYNYVIQLENYNEIDFQNSTLSIDRIDNNGNYEPNNIRIVDWHIQATNRRIQNNNTSGYKGIHFDKNQNKWISRITIKGERIILGSFLNKEEAIETRLNYIKENNLTEYEF